MVAVSSFKKVRPAKKTRPAEKTTPDQYGFGQEQVQRFILLAYILNVAVLELEDMKTCLRKYVGSLRPKQLMDLTAHLPHVVEGIDHLYFPSRNAISDLSGGMMTVADVSEMVTRAQLRFVDMPSSGHGKKGWLTDLLYALALDTSSQHPGAQDTPWFVEPACALWLPNMARFRILLSKDEWRLQVPDSLDRAYRDGWMGVFGVLREAAPSDSTVPVHPCAAGVGIHIPTRDFFYRQTYDPRYVSLAAEMPAVVRLRSNQLRRELGLQPQGSNGRGGGANGKPWGNRWNRGGRKPGKRAPWRGVGSQGVDRMQNGKQEVIQRGY